ncbi:glutamyl-tRNA reductase [Fusibacter bizertensis]
MKINVIGINHDTATVAQREKIAKLHLNAFDIKAQADLSELCILSTCGRFEIYFVVPASTYQENVDQVLATLKTPFGDDLPEFYWHTQEFAISHLLKVTCGLDSAVLGEDQILGQVKNAISDASEQGFASKILNKVFREAVSFAKSIKTELKLSENPLSLSYIAVKKAGQAGYLTEHHTATMVGLGKMGGLAIQYLLDSPIKCVYVSVRHPEKLEDFILNHPKVRIQSFEARYACIEKSQLVIATTAAPHTVIRSDAFKPPSEDILIIDLAMPRDVEAEIGKHKHVSLWNVDELKDISAENYQKRHDLTRQVILRVDEKSRSIMVWIDQLHVDDILKSWHQTIESITQEAMKSVDRKRLAVTLKDREMLEILFESSLKQLIKPPLETLKAIEDKGQRETYVGMLKELYHYE